MNDCATSRHQQGLSLVECAIATVIVALVAGLALPSFHELHLQRQLEGVAAQLETDLQLTRAESVARNEGLRVAFVDDASGSCYVVHTGPKAACRCEGTGATVCAAGATALRSVHLPPDDAVHLRSNSASMLFDPEKGTVTPTGTVKARSTAGHLHLVVNVMGRIRACTPDAAVPGYRRC